jgi:hypothetical protein
MALEDNHSENRCMNSNGHIDLEQTNNLFRSINEHSQSYRLDLTLASNLLILLESNLK